MTTASNPDHIELKHMCKSSKDNIMYTTVACSASLVVLSLYFLMVIFGGDAFYYLGLIGLVIPIGLIFSRRRYIIQTKRHLNVRLVRLHGRKYDGNCGKLFSNGVSNNG